MKIKISHIISSFAFIAITQLLFFWLIPASHDCFWFAYPFYTIMALANTLISVLVGEKCKCPAAFAPIVIGSIITISEMIASICLLLFCPTGRTILFVQLIITMVYILAQTIFISIAAKESENASAVPHAVTPFTGTNSTVSPANQSSARRKVTSINP